MWPFRRKKPRRVEVSRHSFGGHQMGIWFHTKPNPGIRFPLKNRETVSVIVESHRHGVISAVVNFTPIDDVVEDLVRSTIELEITKDGAPFVRLPITKVIREGNIITVRAEEESRA